MQGQVGCTDQCKCKNCANPKGNRTIGQSPQRKRYKHDWQLHIARSVHTAIDLGEKIPHGHRTITEFFVLEGIFKYCLDEGINPASDIIYKIYNIIVEVAQAVHESFPISAKDIDSIEKFLKEHEHILELYQSLCISKLVTTLDL